jgi:hypothetical protein
MKLEVLKKLSYLTLVSFPTLLVATTATTGTNTVAENSAVEETETVLATNTVQSTRMSSSEAASLKKEIQLLNTKTRYLEERMNRMNNEEVEASRTTSFGTLPRFGIGADVFGDDLYIHDFGLNRDLQLLLQKEYIQQTIGSFDGNPRILISGLITAKADSRTDDSFGIYEDVNGQTMDATSAIDFSAFVSDWWMGYFEFDGDSAGGVTVDQIFATAGNLDKFPGYATLGFIYVPNGSYRTKMITDSLPQKLARTRENTALLGFDYAEFEYAGFNGAVYVMDAEPQETETNRFNQWGANLAMRHVPLAKGSFAYDIGVSFMNNIASSAGISSELPDDTILNGYVPAFNVRGKASKGPVFGYAEYVFSIDAFNKNNVADGVVTPTPDHFADIQSVMPNASHFEVGVNFNCYVPMSWVVAYDQTNDSLAFGLPEQQYGSTLEMDVYENTILSVEYSQLRDYSDDTVAIIDGGHTVFGTDELDKVARLQIDVYF